MSSGGAGDVRARAAQPSARLWNVRAIELLGPGVVTGGVATAIAWTWGGSIAALVVLAIACVLLTFGAMTLRRRVRSWGYVEREDDLVIFRGVMFKKLSVVPYGRMQFIDVRAGPVERFFDVATVQLHTAAAATDARIPGLEQREADRLRDHLAALGEARSSGL